MKPLPNGAWSRHGKKKFSELYWNGYRIYRTGEMLVQNVYVQQGQRISLPGRPKDRPILSKGKRESLVKKVFAAMSDWKSSPFQFEGTARHWLRQTFCLQGYSWSRSDAEAAYIVGEALKGHPRPTWEAGQPNHTIGDDFCKGCGGVLDEADIANGVRYCCDECRRITRHRSDRLSLGEVTVLGPVKCKNPACDRIFFPRNFLHEVCSHACRVAWKEYSLPQRSCETCWQVFQPRHEKQLYCGPSCRVKARQQKNKDATAASRPMLICEWCGEPFKQGRHNSRFCSEKHQKAAAKLRERERKAAKIGSHLINKLFDAAA